MKKAVMFFAEGLEECEGLIVVDLLRRAGIEVIMASIGSDRMITGSHGIVIQTDALADEVDYASADIVILPGGMPGTTYLGESEIVREQCKAFAAEKEVAAICAAPTVLGSLGILEGKRATCYPGLEEKLTGATATGESVTEDGNIVTGQGLGAAMPFAFAIIRRLLGAEAADEVRESICYR